MKTLHELLAKYDNIERKNFNERDLARELFALLNSEYENNKVEIEFEIIAFELDPNPNNSPWNTYYGPLSRITKDGLTYERPSLSLITPESVSYWGHRVDMAKNPILKSRYADIVWDLQKKVCGTNPTIKCAEILIEATIEFVVGKYDDAISGNVERLSRALSLSLGINKIKLRDKVINTILNYERSLEDQKMATHWGFSYDLLFNENKIKVDPVVEGKIIEQLESRYYDGISLAKSTFGDIWTYRHIAEYLASYYKRKGNINKAKEIISILIDTAINSFQTAESKGLHKQTQLEYLRKLCISYSMKEEEKMLTLEIQKNNHEMLLTMGKFSYNFEILTAAFDEIINRIERYGEQNIIPYFIFEFIPLKQATIASLQQKFQNSSISYFGSTLVIDSKGRTVAQIGSIEEDEYGHIVAEHSRYISLYSIYLSGTLNKLLSKSTLIMKMILEKLSSCPIINDNNLRILNLALVCYENKQFLEFMHLVIPQIESTIRNFIELSGGVVIREKNNAYNYRSLDELINDTKFTSIYGEDIALYLRTIFTDPRGLNLRNNLCHGLLDMSSFNQQNADLILHALLCLTLVSSNNEDSDPGESA